MARLTLILTVISLVLGLLGGFRLVVNEWHYWKNRHRKGHDEMY